MCYDNLKLKRKEIVIMKKLNKFEKIWLTVFILLITTATCYYSYTAETKDFWLNWVISPLSAITGVICVVYAAKGNILTYSWGIINCITYGYVAYKGGIYGDMLINIFFFLPFQFIGFFVWKKKIKNEVIESKFLKNPISVMLFGILSLYIFTKVLTTLDNWFTTNMKKSSGFYSYLETLVPYKWFGAFLDATTELGQFFGQILMTWAKVEQWYAWIIVDIVSIYMWTAIIVADNSTMSWALPALIMWIGFLINAFYGLYNWKKIAKENK
jgi:nicotinamide mononucleotide transporter